MATLTGIIGESGSGKSTSIKHLNPETTYLINTASKELPFKGSKKLYNVENKNYFEPANTNEVIAKIKVVAEKAPHIKDIVIEDGNYLMAFGLMNKAMETGYTKFTVAAKEMVNLVQEIKKLRSDLNVFFFSHSETVTDGDEIAGYKIKTSGKMIDNQIVMEGLFTTVLYATVECKSDDCKHYFVTNRYGKIPAKSPQGMFDSIKIDNNLQIVSDKVREYYEA